MIVVAEMADSVLVLEAKRATMLDAIFESRAGTNY